MHAGKNEESIILNIDLFITKVNTLNCDDTNNKSKNRKSINTYLSVRLNQYSKIIENDNNIKKSDKNTSLKKNFYVVINDEKFNKEMNNLIEQTYI